MNDLFIHKPKGKIISDELKAKLIKKYPGFWQFTIRKEEEENNKPVYIWEVPKKITLRGEMESCTECFAENVESVIQFSIVNSSKDKGTNFFIPSNKRENNADWAMGFISCNAKNCIDETFNTVPHTQIDYNTRCEQKVLSKFILEKLCNASILHVMKFLLKDSGVESVIVSNGIVNMFSAKIFKEDGIKFSNLDYDNDLPEKTVDAITTILAWKKYEQNPEIDVKKEIENLKTEPHRFLKSLFEKIKGSKFLQIFS